MDWAKTTARQDEKHFSFVIWCDLYKRFDGSFNAEEWCMIQIQIQCTWKTFMIHRTNVRWAFNILFNFVKSLIRHLGLAIGNVRWFTWTLQIIANAMELHLSCTNPSRLFLQNNSVHDLTQWTPLSHSPLVYSASPNGPWEAWWRYGSVAWWNRWTVSYPQWPSHSEEQQQQSIIQNNHWSFI